MVSFTQNIDKPSEIPLCPVFGECGGCKYQDVLYEEELKIKETQLKELFKSDFACDEKLFEPIVGSVDHYWYRNRLDLKLIKTKDDRVLIGFTPLSGRGIIPVDACPIAMKPISEFIPELKVEAIKKLGLKYRRANLVVRTGEELKVRWGGVGRRSCQLSEDEYFYIKINNRKIFYSLDTFFQANLSILPKLFEYLKTLPFISKESIFFDLYGGVGLFSVGLYDFFQHVVLIEDSSQSVTLANYNKTYHQLNNLTIIEGRVEDVLSRQLDKCSHNSLVAMIDPPRAGLSKEAKSVLTEKKAFKHLLYLSCNPESLVRDLKELGEAGWAMKKIIPFDFFPRTKHLETLVILE